MDEEALNSRLSRISTIWTLLADAREAPGTGARDAQLALFERYQGAAYRYLLGAVRDPNLADELFQEFALRCLQGGFRRANPQCGRFRDYLKTILYHLIVDLQKRQRRGPRQLESRALPPEVPVWDPAESDRRFIESWRDELLGRAWAALADRERGGGQPYYRVLRFRAENAKASSGEMAARLTEQLRPQRPFTETGIRKTLQRAREHFADLLIDEVAHSLSDPAPEELEEELASLELLPYCRSVLARRLGRR
jgi:RNA polymerase sigma factor (sigma-70 family)